MIVVFGCSFLFLDDCFLRCWDSRNPCGARWAGGFVCPLWDLETIKAGRGLPLADLAVAQGLSAGLLGNSGFFFRCFLPGVLRVSQFWVGVRSVLGLFSARVRPSGRPPPGVFFVRPVLAVFLVPVAFVSCILHLSLLR